MSDDVDDEVFAEVSWNSEDVQTLRPDWSEEKCNELLAQAEDNMQSIMIAQGWSVLENEIRWYEVSHKSKEVSDES